MSVHPYLFLSGTARQAMTRYQEILGGELDLAGFDQLPAGEEPPPFPSPRERSCTLRSASATGIS